MRDRPASRGAQGWAVWVSGRPGSGKTTIVSMLRARLIGRGIPVVVLEVAEFATAIAPGGVPSAKQRAIITRAVIQAAKLLTDAGRAVLIDGAVPHRESGRVARELITNFAHVELACPLDLCRDRERAVRWNLVACPQAPYPMAAPDLGLEYDAAVDADLTLYTDAVGEWTAAEEVLRLADRLERAACERRRSCA